MIPIGYIYRIQNLQTNQIYIGLTKRSKWINRIKEHFDKSGKSCLKDSIKTYGKSNFLSSLICECYSDDDLENSEKYFISYYNSMENGFNRTSGGQQGSLSKESKDKISKANKGNLHSKKTKKVICLNDDKEFKSVTEASKYYGIHKITVSSICRNLQSENRNGLKFKFLNENDLIIKHSKETKNKIGLKKQKKIICLETKEIFNSAKEAGEKMKLKRGLISKVANGLINQTHGFTFKWIENSKTKEINIAKRNKKKQENLVKMNQNRLKLFGVSSKSEFFKIAKKCSGPKEAMKKFNCSRKLLENCLRDWKGNKNFYIALGIEK